MTPRELHESCRRTIGADYPPKLISIPEPVAGPGFFPIASGSFHSGELDRPLGRRPLLIVGQDWGCEKDIKALQDDSRADINTGTGKRLLDLLKATTVNPDDCFLSNALWGVRRGDKNTGRSPGWDDDRFVERCRQALSHQISCLEPRAIICLGRFAPLLVERIHRECEVWNGATTIAKIDELSASLISLSPPFGSSVRKLALLVHPCYRHVNVRKRHFGAARGNDAEIAILQAC